jgi:hypothetical protein
MKRWIPFAVLLSICTLLPVSTPGTIQKTKAISADGRILWQFDSGA